MGREEGLEDGTSGPRSHRCEEKSGVSVDVVSEKKTKNIQDVDVNGQPQGEVQKDQVKCRGGGAADGDAGEKDPGQGT